MTDRGQSPMSVSVRVHGILIARTGRDREVMVQGNPETVRDLLTVLDIPESEVGMVVIAGKMVTLDSRVNPPVHVDLFPPLAGG